MQKSPAAAREYAAPILDLDTLPDGAMLTPQETARALKVSVGTLSNSRAQHSDRAKFANKQTGMLCGVPAPPYVRFGRLVRYRAGDVRKWLAQFETRSPLQERAS